MNKVSQFIMCIPEVDLVHAVMDMYFLKNEGVLPFDSIILTLTRQLVEQIGLTTHDARAVVESEIMARAAYQYVGVKYA